MGRSGAIIETVDFETARWWTIKKFFDMEELQAQYRPHGWLISGVSLLLSSRRLIENTPELGAEMRRLHKLQSGTSQGSGEYFQLLFPTLNSGLQIRTCLMLAGYATENALKGLIQARGATPPMSGPKAHDLSFLLSEAHLDDPPGIDRAYLERAQEAVLWSGRYPFDKKFDASIGTLADNHTEVYTFAVRLVNRLAANIGALGLPDLGLRPEGER